MDQIANARRWYAEDLRCKTTILRTHTSSRPSAPSRERRSSAQVLGGSYHTPTGSRSSPRTTIRVGSSTTSWSRLT